MAPVPVSRTLLRPSSYEDLTHGRLPLDLLDAGAQANNPGLHWAGNVMHSKAS
eukprot:SAG22_NODE_1917_length_3316_cov_4.498912_4_plen_53_part_00